MVPLLGRGGVDVELHSELLERPAACSMHWQNTVDTLEAVLEPYRFIEGLLVVRVTGLHGVPADATN